MNKFVYNYTTIIRHRGIVQKSAIKVSAVCCSTAGIFYGGKTR